MQRVGNLLDDWVLSRHQVEPAGEKVNVRINLDCLSNNSLDAGMRAAHHENDAVRRINGQRQLSAPMGGGDSEHRWPIRKGGHVRLQSGAWGCNPLQMGSGGLIHRVSTWHRLPVTA
jgi:hypothetical protein